MADTVQAQDPVISTRIFTRFYIPFILSLLVIAFLFVLVSIAPGLSMESISTGNGMSLRRNSNT